MDDNINNIDDKPTNALEAYHIACRFYDEDKIRLPEKYDYLAEIILNDNFLKHPGILLWWGKNIKTHMDEMFNKLLQFYEVDACVEWYIMVNYSKNEELKIKVIENKDVDKWIDHFNSINMHLYNNRIVYTTEDFYADLPDDHKLGVVI